MIINKMIIKIVDARYQRENKIWLRFKASTGQTPFKIDPLR